jgi:hypothetical protein
MSEDQPDRAERRREQKENPTWNEKEWGPLAWRAFDKCPVCGCKSRYTLEALRSEISPEKLAQKPPALQATQMVYETPFYRTTITVVWDSCCQCGALYTVARGKDKKAIIFKAKGGDMPGMVKGG